VFFKDIYGLISTRAASDEFGNQISVYVNQDYASARGFEASITKSFSHKFSAEVNYTYQIATGVASDPRAAQQFITGSGLYLPISEQPLDWDQRSTLTIQGVVRDPGRWGFRFSGRSGRASRSPPPSATTGSPNPRSTTRAGCLRTRSSRSTATSTSGCGDRT